jgi:hypothetical protein
MIVKVKKKKKKKEIRNKKVKSNQGLWERLRKSQKNI